MTREEIEKRAEDYAESIQDGPIVDVSLIIETAGHFTAGAIEISNAQIDEAITELRKYNGAYESRAAVIHLLESLKIKQ
jgi:hypothetical protein